MEGELAAGGGLIYLAPARGGAPHPGARLRRHWLEERHTAAGLLCGPLPLVGPPLRAAATKHLNHPIECAVFTSQ